MYHTVDAIAVRIKILSVASN